jgi:hypothetical protein
MPPSVRPPPPSHDQVGVRDGDAHARVHCDVRVGVVITHARGHLHDDPRHCGSQDDCPDEPRRAEVIDARRREAESVAAPGAPGVGARRIPLHDAPSEGVRADGDILVDRGGAASRVGGARLRKRQAVEARVHPPRNARVYLRVRRHLVLEAIVRIGQRVVPQVNGVRGHIHHHARDSRRCRLGLCHLCICA